MNKDKDIEQKEIIAVATSIGPLIEAYKRGDLSKEEEDFLRAVAQSVWPTLQSVIANIWDELEPILIELNLWPIEEE